MWRMFTPSSVYLMCMSQWSTVQAFTFGMRRRNGQAWLSASSYLELQFNCSVWNGTGMMVMTDDATFLSYTYCTWASSKGTIYSKILQKLTLIMISETFPVLKTTLLCVFVSILRQVVGLHEVCAARAGLGGRARSFHHAAGRRCRSLAAGSPSADTTPEPAAGVRHGINRCGRHVTRSNFISNLWHFL